MARTGYPTDDWKQALGKEKGEFLSHFWHEEQRLIALWTQLNGLLGLKRKDQDILNDTIPDFTRIVIDSMWRDMIVSLCVFVDEPGQGDKTSVSFRSWLKDFGPMDGSSMKQLKDTMDDYACHMSPITHMRNKHIAHKNRQLLLNEPKRPDSIQLKHLGNAMERLHRVIVLVFETNGLSYLGSDAHMRAGGVSNLVQYISAGLDHDRYPQRAAHCP